MSASDYPPEVGHKFCRMADGTSMKEIALSCFSPEFKERYGRPFLEWVCWDVRIGRHIPNDITIPKYRIGFARLVITIDFVQFCGAVDNANALRTVPVSRQDKEGSWCQLVLKKYDDVKDADRVELIGKRLGTANVLSSEQEVHECLKSLFCDMVQQVLSEEAEDYWKDMARSYPDMDTSKFNLDMASLEFHMLTMDIEPKKGKEEEAGDEEEDEEDDEDDEDEDSVPAWFREVRKGSRDQGGGGDIEDEEGFYRAYFRREGSEEEEECDEAEDGRPWGEDEDEDEGELEEDGDAMDLD
ncbi:uncharacterized protein BP5553_03916 [Venustampulla echinocandica]|uniref:Uncharacterized protein n=1 Tax=Venustampulla echinocandica TaxID=2656787 RepID=A0A370TVM1_9HELO|nr:uncharacterized protein BP5553_03916 [Venustampulla echinocandica]RDL39576.1 hypothetical protein BP5553_03916 [Venustampulla echinocandica]